MTTWFEYFSTLTCGACGHRQKIQMPVYAKRILYECPQCGTLHRSGKSACCIFCAFGDVKCPGGQMTNPA